MSRTHRLQDNQQGIISIMMTVVMIIVISLIVLGLAQISRREQRQSTDNQLSTQAFYAAESGVNDVVSYLRSVGHIIEKNDCTNGAPYNTVLEPVIDTDKGISYSCVLVDAGPPTITAPVTPASTVYNLSSTPALDQLTFTWTPATGVPSASLSNCPNATAINKKDFLRNKAGTGSADWKCPYAILRVDLVDASSVTRDDLINNTQTVFLVPVKGSNTKTLGSGPRLQSANCNDLTSCSYTFTVPSGSSYYARVNSIYRGGTLTINGATSSGGPISFDGVATIDVTGKAQDVLRRIKATVNIQGSNQNTDANAALVSGHSICKYYGIDRTTGRANSASICP